MIANGHADLWKRTVNFFSSGSSEVCGAIQHALFSWTLFFLNRGPPQHEKENEWQSSTIFTPWLLIPAPPLKTFPSVPSVRRVWRAVGVKEAKKVSGTCACFSSKIDLVIDIGLVKIFLFQFNTAKNKFSVYVTFLSFRRISYIGSLLLWVSSLFLWRINS